MIDKAQVEKIAKLVKLDLTDSEKDKFAKMFSETLDYIEILKELSTDEVLETYQVNGQINVFQHENAIATLEVEAVLSNASKKSKNLFVTDGVFDRE